MEATEAMRAVAIRVSRVTPFAALELVPIVRSLRDVGVQGEWWQWVLEWIVCRAMESQRSPRHVFEQLVLNEQEVV